MKRANGKRVYKIYQQIVGHFVGWSKIINNVCYSSTKICIPELMHYKTGSHTSGMWNSIDQTVKSLYTYIYLIIYTTADGKPVTLT